jgi:hypothetical protein
VNLIKRCSFHLFRSNDAALKISALLRLVCYICSNCDVGSRAGARSYKKEEVSYDLNDFPQLQVNKAIVYFSNP